MANLMSLMTAQMREPAPHQDTNFLHLRSALHAPSQPTLHPHFEATLFGVFSSQTARLLDCNRAGPPTTPSPSGSVGMLLRVCVPLYGQNMVIRKSVLKFSNVWRFSGRIFVIGLL